MTKAFYPHLSLDELSKLKTLHEQYLANQDYLLSKACPYDVETRANLSVILNRPEGEKSVVAQTPDRSSKKTGPRPKYDTKGIEVNEVVSEIAEIRKELSQLKTDSKALETADRIQIIKTRAGLVEKMVVLAERANNLKRLNLYQMTVIGILDDLITDKDREEFMKRIEPFAREEG